MKELDSFTAERLEELGAGAMFFTGDEVAALARIALAAKRAEESHSRREVWDGGNTWIQCSKQAYDRHEAAGKRVRVLYERPQLNSPEIPDGWIKCSDQMPENSTDVTLFHPEIGVFNGYCWRGLIKDKEPIFFSNSGEHDDGQKQGITHWMPLPAAPEKP